MLSRLHISNYALIDFLDISFKEGLSSITGETGAGKSIILGALSLLLGKRCDTNVLKNKDQKSVVEAEFTLDKVQFAPIFAKHDADFDTHTIIRREITPQGKSRAFINDTPVGLQALKEIGELLFDIHSQHQNLFLKDSMFQCQVIDAAANNAEELQHYANLYAAMQHAQRELNEHKQLIAKNSADLSYFEFRLQELQTAKLQNDNELQELEEECALMENSEDIKQLLAQAEEMFNGEAAFLPQLKQLSTGFEKKSQLGATFLEFSTRLQQSYIELHDLAAEISSYNARMDFDSSRLTELQLRIDIIQSLLHKYNCKSISELKVEQQRLQSLVDNISNAAFNTEELEKAYEAHKKAAWKSAETIRNNRKKAISAIVPQITTTLQKLGMPSVVFAIELQPLQELQANGADAVQMLFSANKNITPQWLGEISSGGELSRVMLCLKAILAQAKSIRTIVFDEIDTGVSGEIAEQMGEIMQEMAKNLQVIVITHLPQIAAQGQVQFKVYKTETADTTTTNIIELSQEQRVEEIAKMMSGKQVSEAAILNAKHLLGFVE
ncbi:MAG: DNA repair protein RecN [Bacteroidales bacterium]|jgi:DNA repair protein RecN (Recombination protein N)|nr:DNA repair protein RecN [Bacteroidales bacterium]